MIEALSAAPIPLRIALFVALAIASHLLVQALQGGAQRLLAPSDVAGAAAKDAVARRYPKFATLTSLIVSALTFAIYFVAVGLVLAEFNVSIRAYLTTASVVGLAVGFGLQGLVQDVVMGLTLIFSDAFDVGETIEVSGQVGRVDQIGLRFTRLVNFQGQTVYVPNRNIALVGRYRRNVIRAYVDVQVPEDAPPESVAATLLRIAQGIRNQYRSVVVTDPELFGVQRAEPGEWRYVRVKFRLWPGQTAVIETTYRQRIIAAMKQIDPGFADWMTSVTYRVA